MSERHLAQLMPIVHTGKESAMLFPRRERHVVVVVFWHERNDALWACQLATWHDVEEGRTLCPWMQHFVVYSAHGHPGHSLAQSGVGKE